MRGIKVAEEDCPACDGKGTLPFIAQAKPGRRIYPPRCTRCEGKGKVMKKAAN